MISEAGLAMCYSYCYYSLFYLETTVSPNLGQKVDSCHKGITTEVRKRCMKNPLNQTTDLFSSAFCA